ncbi:MAG: SUMF1/EgtB/PvdO family nonheme iron enzyme [Deltaproteobacteria bacterium]|nr:SUMF1/EgtB/PvdO family nonheme iron enzyme [Deltaproteobacteria bacterium]
MTSGAGRWRGPAAGLAFAIGLGAAGCGSQSATAPALLEPAKAGEAFGGVQCSAIRPPTEPDLMGWDSGSRLNLKSLQESGVVAVRYRAEGCNVELEVLSCVGKGEYRFSPYKATETKLARSAQELYTELPIGAAKLGGKLAGGRALRTDYMLAGVLTLPVMKSFPAGELSGDCDRATHVVAKMYVGGFAMAAGERERLAAGASLFGVGAGGERDRSAERITEEGDAEACARAQKEAKREPTCGVPLRIGLVPIEGRAQGGCPQGSSWDGAQCVQKQVVTEVECPAGTTLQGGKCVAAVDRSCKAGMHFEEGRGCVANVVAPQPASVSPPPARAAAGGSCPAGMAYIPAGSFMMGSDGGYEDEKPVHRVSLGAYCMDLYEVTVEGYRRCTGCSAPDTGELCNWGVAGRYRHPVNCVDWGQATAYCSFAGKRLPTEEEWEYAARGSEGRTYPWGNSAPGSQLCWNGEGNDLGRGNRRSTCPVGAYLAGRSPFGLFDMAGNVWEWTASRYCPYSSKNCANEARVIRGGSWRIDVASDVRAAFRSSVVPGYYVDDNLGLRCAR